MPMQWTKPEVAAEHAGVKVYHTYKGPDEISGFWYTLDPSNDDIDSDEAFDIRDLNSYEDPNAPHEAILRDAIEAGELRAEAQAA